ncbi:MAG: hypothetical protein QW327_04045 [Candidatus Odinarchaeota archaeon]
MAEEIEKLVDKLKTGINLPNVRVGLFDIQGHILYSSLGEKASELASKLTKGAFAAWDIGDYQVKHLEKGCLLVSRVTEKLALAIDSFEREGLVIVTMGALMKRFADEFEKIDKLLPGKPISVPIPEEKPVAEAPAKIEAKPEPVKPVAETAVKTQPTSPLINITPDLILTVSQANINKIEMDPIMLSLIRGFDGIKPVSEVIKIAGVDFNNAMPRITKLVENNILKVVSKPEEDNLTYQYVYELVPPYTPDNVAERACAGRSDEVVTIMVNLDRGYTVEELSVGLSKVGLKKTPQEVYEILEYYRGINVAKIKQIGSGDISELLKNPAYQAIYTYTPGMKYEEAVKKLVIGDRKTIIVLRNIDLRRPVAEIYNGIRSLNIETTPEEVLKIFEELERRGIIKKT